MNLNDLIGHVRRDLDDMVNNPYLYSDEELTGWLNQAVLEAAIRARLLKDDARTNPTMCALAVTAGQYDVAISDLIFVVRHAHMAAGSRPLLRVTTKTLDRLEPGWDQLTPADIAGTPKYLVMDVSQGLVRLHPPTAAADTLNIRVWRKPLEDEVLELPDDEPAVRITDPEALKHWALRCAYLVKDSELYDPERATQHEGIFEARFGKRPTEHEMQRWLDNPPTAPRGHFF